MKLSTPFIYTKHSTISQISSRKAKLCIPRKREAKLVNEPAIYLTTHTAGHDEFPQGLKQLIRG